jgi:hypothetical protein
MISIYCIVCGINFGFSENIETLWRESHKSFFCPNGHSLSWLEDSSGEKELKKLQDEVKELRLKLKAATDEAASQTKRIEELVSELEIWKPSERTA